MLIRNVTLALSLAANLFLAVKIHNMKALEVLIHEKVAAQMPAVSERGFNIGCQVAAQGIAHKDPRDADYPLVEDWCKHNAKYYGKEK